MIRRRHSAGLMLAAAVAAASGVARAHDAEHTAVSMTFARDGSFVLDVANDPNWLLLRLESFVGLDAPSSNPADRLRQGYGGQEAGSHKSIGIDRDARLRELASVFIDRIVIFVDGHEVRPPFVEYLAPPPQLAGGPTPLAAFRLRGRVSPEARVLRWYYGMVVDPYPLAITRADGRSQHERIVAGDAWSGSIDLTGQFVKSTRHEIALRYWRLGYELVLPRGGGHVLFILGMLLLSLRARPIVLQLGAFTAAHAAALWLTAFGIVSLPSRVIGALIVLSVAYVVIENLMTTNLKPWRVPAVCVFGVVHGAAFGNAVKDLGLTRSELPAALAWFTTGVESAQLTLVAFVALLLFAGSNRLRARRFGVSRRSSPGIRPRA